MQVSTTGHCFITKADADFINRLQVNNEENSMTFDKSKPEIQLTDENERNEDSDNVLPRDVLKKYKPEDFPEHISSSMIRNSEKNDARKASKPMTKQKRKIEVIVLKYLVLDKNSFIYTIYICGLY